MGRGDEVVTSPFSFVASANCLLYEGAKPVFCDVEPVTLNLDPAAAREAIGERTAGLLPVDILGYPAAVPELEQVADEGGLGLLQDACEALGARDAEGRLVGSRGNLATFAFYANKQLTTGEGGMLAVGDPESAARLRSERNQGRAPDMGWVDHDRLGFNYRLTELQAALGVAQLERLGRDARRTAGGGDVHRAPRGARLRRAGGGGDPAGLVLPCRDRARSGGAGRLRGPAPGGGRPRRGARRPRPAGDRGKAYMPSIHLMGFYRERFGFRKGQFPVAEDASARLLALPFFAAISGRRSTGVRGAGRGAARRLDLGRIKKV